MNKKKIVLVLIALVLVIFTVRSKIITLKAKEADHVTQKNPVVNQTALEEKEANNHLIYISTPIGSVGIL